MHERHLGTLVVASLLFFVGVLVIEHHHYTIQNSGSRNLSRSSRLTLHLNGVRGERHDQPAATDEKEVPGRNEELPRPEFVPGDGRGRVLFNAALIVFCYNRPEYLERTLHSLANLTGLSHISVYISQDGDDEKVTEVVDRFGDRELRASRTRVFDHWHRSRQPLLSPKQPGHAWLSQHYRWGLNRLFERGHSHAIVVEDDMIFSPDFITYFRATAVLLEKDPTLWCISSWNDNGLQTFSWDARKLFRTSYFPGLGWMMRRQLWEEIGPSFPLLAWDHWMRLNTTSKGRECVAPEVNRNLNIGEKGANMERHMFKSYLSRMAHATEAVTDFGDLSYLLKPNYDAHVKALIAQARVYSQPALHIGSAMPSGEVLLVPYKIEDYARLTRSWRVWAFPRGHHDHLTIIPYRNSTYLLADRRFCPFLPDELRVRPSPTLATVAGTRNASCTQMCRGMNKECSAPDFWFINGCSQLRQHFPCEAGCTVELGRDIPNYVMDETLPSHRMCLVTQQPPKCEASHPGTARLCPCVDPAAPQVEAEREQGVAKDLEAMSARLEEAVRRARLQVEEARTALGQ